MYNPYAPEESQPTAAPVNPWQPPSFEDEQRRREEEEAMRITLAQSGLPEGLAATLAAAQRAAQQREQSGGGSSITGIARLFGGG